MVTHKKGNLLEAKEDIIAHGVNCRGGFGSGVAGQIAKKYPKAQHAYFHKFQIDGWDLGDVDFVPQYDRKIIANCATQDNFGYKNELHVDYNAIRETMTKLKHWAAQHGYSIAVPKIGCGLAGGDWQTVKVILEEVFNDYDCVVYIQ